MSRLSALVAGFAGAATVNLLNETVRTRVDAAPRLDLLGIQALIKGSRFVGQEVPAEHRRSAAMAGDIAANTAYYALSGALGAKRAPYVGGALGLLAGIGAVTLPGTMGLSTKPVRRTPETAAMTIAWYTAGGVVAGLARRMLGR